MRKQNETLERMLTAETVDEFSNHIRAFLGKVKIEKRDALRISLSVEEILLAFLGKDEGNTKVSLLTGEKFFRPFVSLKINGKSYNVFAGRNEETGVLGNSILKNLGLSPEYSYAGEQNIYNFRIKKKTANPFLTLLVALSAAAVAGLIGYVVPDSIRTGILENAFTPLHDTFLNVLGCIAGPMIFLSVAWGIYGIGDAATLKRIGKKMLTSYVGTVYLFTALIGVVCVFVFNLNFNSSFGNASELSSVVSILLNIIPKNIMSPFVDGNTLQIIFLAVVFGIAMLFLGQKTTVVAQVVEQINYIIQFLVEFISKLVPYFIFIVLVEIIWSDNFSTLLNVGKVFAVFCVSAVVMIVIMTTFTALKNKISPESLFKKGFPTLLIAITTASSAAAFGSNIKVCRSEYGIDEKISSFGIPLGMVTFKPTTAVAYTCVSLFFAEIYNIEVSVSWIVIMIFSAGILAIATPPIPGGAITAYTVLFSQLGIPAEAIAVALACDTILDFICTGGDQFMIPFAILNQANRLGLVNKDILKRKKISKRKKG